MQKKLFYGNGLKNAENNPKKVWAILKKAINLSKAKSSIGNIEHNGRIIENDTEKANLFNEHFSRVGIEATSNLPNTNKNFKDYLPLHARIDRTFAFTPITPGVMYEFIKKIKPKKSKDNNGISTEFIHFIAEELSIPLTHIFNISIHHAVFPNVLKVSSSYFQKRFKDRSS